MKLHKEKKSKKFGRNSMHLAEVNWKSSTSKEWVKEEKSLSTPLASVNVSTPIID